MQLLRARDTHKELIATMPCARAASPLPPCHLLTARLVVVSSLLPPLLNDDPCRCCYHKTVTQLSAFSSTTKP
ncbi:hypothetical protein NL676_038740 [Syzygium grande]|nr:hypothetical protein NL676_038740 [Syzygium grande]